MHVDAEGWLLPDANDAQVLHLPTVRTVTLVEGPLGLVWHATGGVGGSNHAESLARRIQRYRRGIDRAVSWNALIARDGTIFQSAPFTTGTWHTGKPGTVGGKWCARINRATIGVELENAGPLVKAGDDFYAWPFWRQVGKERRADHRCLVGRERVAWAAGAAYDGFPQPQVWAAVALARAARLRFGWSRDVAGLCHSDFAAPRKTDPGLLWTATVLPQVIDDAFADDVRPLATSGDDEGEAIDIDLDDPTEVSRPIFAAEG